MWAAVLAAGEGERLKPITENRPKPLFPIAGRPLLDYLLQAVEANGVKDITLVVKHKAEEFKRFVREKGRRRVKINLVLQGEERGTAAALKPLLPLVKSREPILIVYGDLLISPGAISTVLKEYKKRARELISVVEVKNGQRYGVAELTRQGLVQRIEEKPKASGSGPALINAGIYLLKPETLNLIHDVGLSPRGELELTDLINLSIKRGNKILAVRLSSKEWMDLGRPWDLLEANVRVLNSLKRQVLGKVEKGAVLKGAVKIERRARIKSGAYIEGPVYVGSESEIGPNCLIRPYTSIGRKVKIGNACEIKASIILNKAHIAHLSYIGDSIIGEGCNLGAGTLVANIRFDEKPVPMFVGEEVVSSGRRKLGVVLGDGVKTGINVSFMPGVKVGAKSQIGANVLITRDVPSNIRVTLKQELDFKSLENE